MLRVPTLSVPKSPQPSVLAWPCSPVSHQPHFLAAGSERARVKPEPFTLQSEN